MLRLLYIFVLTVVGALWSALGTERESALGSSVYSPVMVTGCNMSGSGFFWQRDSSIYFVTAAHVLFQRDSVLLCSNVTLESHAFIEGKKKMCIWSVDMKAAQQLGLLKRHLTQDIAVMSVGNAFPTGRLDYWQFMVMQKGEDNSMVPILSYMPFEEVTLSNDVFLLGYPRAIGSLNIPQLDYSEPLLRKGIVAGKNLKNNTIVVDCPSYPGNSGGPVIELDRVPGGVSRRVIGVLSQFVPFEERWTNDKYGYANVTLGNSGYSIVVPMDYALDIIKTIRK